VLIITLIISAILIFPIFINFDLCFIKDNKKLYYKLSLFGIKVLRGYVELIKEGVVIHLNKYRAIIIPYKKLFGIRKKFKPLKDYHFIKFNSILELGGKNDLINAISAGFIHNYIFNYLEWFFYHKKPYVDLKYKTIIIKDTNKLNYYCNLTVIFNLLMVVISLIKILMEKIIYAIRNKARQN